MPLTDLRDLQFDEIADLLETGGEPRFRAKQLCHWVYKRQATCIPHMTDIPETLRQRLQQQCYVGALEPMRHQHSQDGTEKFLFRLEDGNQVETVRIPAEDRHTLCVSTQVGCAIGCRFCLTAQGGLVRSLRPGEIVSQVLHFLTPGKAPDRAFYQYRVYGYGRTAGQFSRYRSGAAHYDGRVGTRYFPSAYYRLNIRPGTASGSIRPRGFEG